MSKEETKAEIAELERVLKKCKGKPGFTERVQDIEACLAVLRARV